MNGLHDAEAASENGGKNNDKADAIPPIILNERESSSLNKFIRRPIDLAETGLSESFVGDLISKHLYDGGVATLSDLVKRIGLAGVIIEGVMNWLRQEARIEIRASMQSMGRGAKGLRYALTDYGRTFAIDALNRDGYLGPAPIALPHYRNLVALQSVHKTMVNKEGMRRAFSDITLDKNVLDQLGPASTSGRAIFVYGPAGTGKTYITQRLTRLFTDTCFIPHALLINDSVIPIFDEMLHKEVVSGDVMSNVLLDQGRDPRLVCCERPQVISGGEMTLDMLDVRYDAANRLYQAPLQLKANGGMFIIDDMGRQRVSPQEVFNRWIVPLEERKDYLSMGDGRHFDVPFDQVLIFSSNLNPLDLADEAFLRRIGYKIYFDYLSEDAYRKIWDKECVQRHAVCDGNVLNFVLEELHEKNNVPLLPCHPRDLISIGMDKAHYEGDGLFLTVNHLQWAWDTYFVKLKKEFDA